MSVPQAGRDRGMGGLRERSVAAPSRLDGRGGKNSRFFASGRPERARLAPRETAGLVRVCNGRRMGSGPDALARRTEVTSAGCR